MSLTPCNLEECEALNNNGFCSRHNVSKSKHWISLCQTKPSYFQAWERGVGPGQSKTSQPRKWTPKDTSRGLGDTIAKITNLFGIKPCGGCKERQGILNEWLPYGTQTNMKSPKDQWCIQIEITNYCPKSCSNCTRHCPHIKTPYFMTLDYFKGL